MKRLIKAFLRKLHLLTWADHFHFCLNSLGSFLPNRAFRKANPDFPTPPLFLAFDAYGHTRMDHYRQSGLLHASHFAKLINRHVTQPGINLLEWGCGPGRILRHMGALIQAKPSKIFGSDLNPNSIAWCQKNLKGIEFSKNELLPPLSYADQSMDVIYTYSVFTHLSVEIQKQWIREFKRILKNGGTLLLTTHGNFYRRFLTSGELQDFDKGLPVVQSNFKEGKKLFLAYHPEPFVKKELLDGFQILEFLPGKEEDNWFTQDLWIARLNSRS